MTPHIAEARRAVHLLWAACAGGTLQESIELMRFASALWPEPPLMVGSPGPLADSPSPQAWRNALDALLYARALQEAITPPDKFDLTTEAKQQGNSAREAEK